MTKNDSIKISKTDYLLIIGVVLAPMTGWRIWKIGPGEVLCAFWAALHINGIIRLDLKNHFYTFWLEFLFCIFMGTLWGLIILPEEVALSELLTWLFFFVICITEVAHFQNVDKDYIFAMIKKISVISTIWFFFLYEYSLLVSRTFFGAPLWFGSVRYSGGATNPHQVALLFCINIVVLLYVCLFEKRHRLFLCALAALNLYMLAETKSSTGYLAVAVALFILLYIWAVSLARHKKVFIATTVGIGILFVIFCWNYLFNAFMNWVASDSNGMGRFALVSTFWNAFKKGPIFGLGPGSHAHVLSYAQEFHNTYLDVTAMSGLLGLTACIILNIRIIKKIKNYYLALPILMDFYFFFIPGFGMRRIIFWTFMPLTVICASKADGTKEQPVLV